MESIEILTEKTKLIKPLKEGKWMENFKAEAEVAKAKLMKKMAHAEGISVSEYWYRHVYMNKKQREGVAIILFAAISSYQIKAKLGMPGKQSAYLLQSQTIHAALALDTGGFYSTLLPALLTLLDSQNGVFEQSIKNMKLGVLREAIKTKNGATDSRIKLLKKELTRINPGKFNQFLIKFICESVAPFILHNISGNNYQFLTI